VSVAPRALLPPEVLEPVRGQFGVTDRVLNVAVTAPASARVGNDLVPMLDRHLTGDDGRSALVAIVDDFEEITTLVTGERGEAPANTCIAALCGVPYMSAAEKAFVLMPTVSMTSVSPSQ
jgi:hypothetical protein